MVVDVHAYHSHRGNATPERSRSAAPWIWPRLQHWPWAGWCEATLHTCLGARDTSLGRMPLLVHMQPKLSCNEKRMSGKIVLARPYRDRLLGSSQILTIRPLLLQGTACSWDIICMYVHSQFSQFSVMPILKEWTIFTTVR